MDTVVVFTGKGIETFFAQGGSGDWVANEDRLAKATYLVAVANAHSKVERGHSKEKQGHAFLVGKISGVMAVPEKPKRLIIQVSEYAEIDIPNCWSGQRNPVRYTNLDEFGVNPDELDWKLFPTEYQKPIDTVKPLTVEEAKLGLAKKFGVAPEQIEIIVRA